MASHAVVVPSLVLVTLLLSLSAFFSSSESAIFSLPEEWVEATTADETGESRTLASLRADPHRLLVTLLVGNNLVNVAISSIVTLLVTRVVPPGLAVVLATLSASVLVLVFGEIVPKSYGLGHAESWSLRVARPIAVVERLLGPVVTVFDMTTQALATLLGGDPQIETPYVED